jgi:DNA-binding transcriptional MerR regulator
VVGTSPVVDTSFDHEHREMVHLGTRGAAYSLSDPGTFGTTGTWCDRCRVSRLAFSSASRFTVIDMRIGELAEQAGTSARTLRYYEEHGLLCTRRSANGYRDYDEVDLRLVQEIRSLLEIGFSLEETRPFVECLQSGHGSGGECPASIEVFQRKLDDLDRCIARLREVRTRVHGELTEAVGRRAGTNERK